MMGYPISISRMSKALNLLTWLSQVAASEATHQHQLNWSSPETRLLGVAHRYVLWVSTEIRSVGEHRDTFCGLAHRHTCGVSPTGLSCGIRLAGLPCELAQEAR